MGRALIVPARSVIARRDALKVKLNARFTSPRSINFFVPSTAGFYDDSGVGRFFLTLLLFVKNKKLDLSRVGKR
jgi:hypothetical protein